MEAKIKKREKEGRSFSPLLFKLFIEYVLYDIKKSVEKKQKFKAKRCRCDI